MSCTRLTAGLESGAFVSLARRICSREIDSEKRDRLACTSLEGRDRCRAKGDIFIRNIPVSPCARNSTGRGVPVDYLVTHSGRS